VTSPRRASGQPTPPPPRFVILGPGNHPSAVINSGLSRVSAAARRATVGPAENLRGQQNLGTTAEDDGGEGGPSMMMARAGDDAEGVPSRSAPVTTCKKRP